MATIRESLRKLAEVAKPIPGDEQEFVAKHVIKTFDLQGKDAIHKDETPYEAILKNVAAVKSPSERAEKPGENHGHNKPGESEAAYHVPESREQKLAKLSMMMEATIDPKEQQLADALKSLLAETFSLYLKAHHYHWNVMGPDFAQYHEFLGELYQEVHGAVDMIAENIRVLGELAPGNLGSQDVSKFTDPHMMVVDLMMDNKKVLQSLHNCYKLAESIGRLGISNFLQDRLTAHDKHHWMMQAIAGVKGEEPMQEAKQVTGVKMHYHNPKTGEKFHEIHFSVPAAEKFRKQHEKAGFKLVKKEAQFSEEVEHIDEGTLTHHAHFEPKKDSPIRDHFALPVDGSLSDKDHIKKFRKVFGNNIAKFYDLKKVEKISEEVEQVDEMDNRTPSSDRREQRANSPEEKAKREKELQDNLKKAGSDMRKKLRLPKPKEGVKEEVELDEISHATLGKYIEKADKSADDLASAGKYRQSNDRRLNVIRAQTKQIGQRVAAIKKSMGEETVAENRPLLPKQKEIARDLLKKEMEQRKQERNANRQAGTPKLTEEDKRETNDKAREERTATPRPHAPESTEGMRHRLQSIKKQVIDKT